MNVIADTQHDYCQRFLQQLREAQWYDHEKAWGGYYAYVFDAERACDAGDIERLSRVVDDALLAVQSRDGKCLIAWNWIHELEKWSRQIRRILASQ